MASSNVLTVRLPEDEIARLDAMAELQQRPRSQIVQDAIREKLNSDEQMRAKRIELAKARLAPAIREQCELLGNWSVPDEHRRF